MYGKYVGVILLSNFEIVNESICGISGLSIGKWLFRPMFGEVRP